MDYLNEVKANFLESGEEGKVWKVSLLEEGPSKNGYNGYKRYYPAELLDDVVERFQDIPAFMYQAGRKVFDHLPEEAREIGQLNLNLIGFYQNPRVEEIEGKKNIVADLEIHDGAESVKELFMEMWERGKELGASIVAEGNIEVGNVDGDKYAIMKDIMPKSVDPVTNPATGARFLELKEKEVQNLNFKNELEEVISSVDYDIMENLSVDLEQKTELNSEDKKLILDSVIESLGKENKLLRDQFKLLKGSIGEFSDRKVNDILSFLNSTISEEAMVSEAEIDLIEAIWNNYQGNDLAPLTNTINQGNVQDFLSMLDFEARAAEKEENMGDIEERMDKLENKLSGLEESIGEVMESFKRSRVKEKLRGSSLPNAAEKRIHKQLMETDEGDINLDQIEETIENEEEFVNEIIEDLGSAVTGLSEETEHKKDEGESEKQVQEYFSKKIKR